MKLLNTGMLLVLTFFVQTSFASQYCIPNTSRCYDDAAYRNMTPEQQARLVRKNNAGQLISNPNYRRQVKQVEQADETMAKSTGDGVNRDAERVGSQSGSAAGMNAAIGAAMIAAGMACQPAPCAPLLMMGAMALMQSGADGQQVGYAGNTSADSYAGDKGNNLKKSPKSTLSPGQKRQLDEAKDALADAGIKFNGNGTFTTASGETITGNDFSDPDGLAEKGFSEEDIESAKNGLDIAKEAAKDLRVSHGGSLGGGKKGADGSGFDDGPSLADELNRRSSVAGMTRSLASDRIGVSGDNIFEMLSRRYQKKSRANAFLP